METPKSAEWSHSLNLYVRNSSSKELMAYSVTHQCGDLPKATNKGVNLKVGARTAPVPTATKSGSNDNYTVSLIWADGNTGNTDFYCNAEVDEFSVVIDIHDHNCNSNYFLTANASGNIESSCDNKGSWNS